MEKLLWSKDIFGSKLEITRGNDLIGNIQWNNMISPKARAIINGRYFILNRDIFLSKLEIYDSNDHALLGSIMVNVFNPKSDVVLNGKRFELEISNFWQSCWAWKFNGEEIITYTSNEFVLKEKGEINLFTTCNEEVEVLILLGLFVRNQFVILMLLMLFIVFIILL
jgi:hypothetical protein